MDSKQFVTAGLQPLQAEAYALLLEKGALFPPEAAKSLKTTRTNAYKILDRLVELGLAKRGKQGKKAAYMPDNPLGLVNMLAAERNAIVAREEVVKSMLEQLLERYYEKTEQPTTKVVTGREAVADAYKQQVALRQPVYFVRTKADIPSLGFDMLHEIRVLPSHYGQKRFGITPDNVTGPSNPEGDKRSNLTRTWMRQEDYTAPVEWSVSGSMLLIVLFGSEPHAITIINPVIADAFRQLWHLLSNTLQHMPYYKELPRTSKTTT